MLQLMQNALIGGIFFFVTFCDDSIKNFYYGKLYLGLKAGTTDTFMYVTNPISI